MIHIPHLYRRTLVLSSRILMTMLAGFLLLASQLTSVQAQWTTNGNNISNSNSGNVGVGTSNPTLGKLQVNKSIRIDDDSGSATGSDTMQGAPNLYLGTTTGGNLFQFNGSGGLDLWQYNTGWARTVTFAKNGSVGIGTTSPVALLDVRNSDGLFYAGFGYGTNKETYIRAGSSTNGVVHIGDLNTTKTVLQESGGNVGIGTATPNSQYKLDVAGNINSSGTITGANIVAKYQDLAEWVPSSEQLSAGTVVVLDATRSNEVIGSTQAYDTRVAGVISEQPGIALGEQAANKVLVATTGRVLMKVDATQAAITVGDLLVTSDIPGVAMKSQPLHIAGVQIHRPGTIVGKALEPLAKGQGKILVLLSLQ